MDIDNINRPIYGIKGLTAQQVLESRSRHGRNELVVKRQSFWSVILIIFKEPLSLLLLSAALLYFISGEINHGIFMTFTIVLITGISLYQDSRSSKALDSLRTLTQPLCKVIRNGEIETVKREDIVLDDVMIVEEGSTIPADGIIIQSNDFSVNESILTGESFSVNKNQKDNKEVFQGTMVSGGLAICKVQAIGAHTALGKIGESLESIQEEDTPMQKQISDFVKKMTLAGVVIFLIVWGINFMMSHDILKSLLKALTLAMSILPEEVPVAFTTFIALGSWRLMKQGVIVKQSKTVETLGSATVLCTDKTGTITENRMSLAKLFILSGNKIVIPGMRSVEVGELIKFGMWASEPIPFDPMEIALHDAYSKSFWTDERKAYHMIHEYPLGGKPPMMTHVYENDSGHRIIAAKGAPEAMIKVSNVSDEEKKLISEALQKLTNEGYRVLGVSSSQFEGNDFPTEQQQINFKFLGLVAFYDPPKANISEVFESLYKAGIDVKIITGDNAATTSTVAAQVNFRGSDKTMSGEELLEMSEEEVKENVMGVNIFTRMFPEAKLKILNALKANGQIVAMTGDGVNDGPALKAAHIGIAMGKKGTEIAKEVSSLILVDDDLAKLVDAVAMGRRIYANLKKAIQYIISIHIPIILTVFIPLALGWRFPNIFTPVHVIFLELIMGPTCSIIYENEPIEKNTMQQRPRPFNKSFFNFRELSTSIVQGLMISLGVLGVYQFSVYHTYDEAVTRTMVFLTLISANIFLTLVNRSFYYSLFATLRYKNNLVPLIIVITIGLTTAILFIPAIANFFEFKLLKSIQFVISVLVGCIAVVWYEVVKAVKRART